MTIHCIVVSAGVGKRFGTSKPKQYTPIHGKTVLQHSLYALSQVNDLTDCYLVVSNEDEVAKTLDFAMPIHWVIGGAERMNSVFNGVQTIWQSLDTLAQSQDWVLIHDAARPCVLPQDIEKLIQSVTDADIASSAGGILAVPVRDTVKQIIEQDNQVLAKTTIDRSQLWLAQTPQIFPLAKLYDYLSQAIEQAIPFTDEASLFEYFANKLGNEEYPLLVEGSHSNIKLTFPEDLMFAEVFLTHQGVNTL
ncbi:MULTISPECIES: 2-C-methyl-D-erythritol 4-phosphate cytidylyltransferase [unclassified Moraxella]|uniref:2-C-methyl-D-erythritol 4-phosphate cytidylyltransferase n=1 Tax=unclassified Moraxella TaxID=2685852 RepID=UPI003AF71B98